LKHKEKKKQLRKLNDRAKDCANTARKLWLDEGTKDPEQIKLLDEAHSAFIEASNKLTAAMDCTVKI